MRSRGRTHETRMMPSRAPYSNSNEPGPSRYPGRARESPNNDSRDARTPLLMERVRRAGILTNVNEQQLPLSTKTLIDDLHFKLQQLMDAKERMTAKALDLLKSQKTRQREEEQSKDRHIVRQRVQDPLFLFPSISLAPSSTGLSPNFERLRPNPGTEPTVPRDPPLTRGLSVMVTPLGTLENRECHGFTNPYGLM